MSWRAYNWLYAMLSISLLILVVALNIFADPFGVFKTQIVLNGPQTNERYLKTEHLLGSERYDTLLLGSSRVGVLPPSMLGELLPGEKIYNYSFFYAKPNEILLSMRHLKRKGLLPKRVIMGIDMYPYNKKFKTPDNYQFSCHPDVSGENKALFYLRYLFYNPLYSIFKQWTNIYTDPYLRFNFEQGNQTYLILPKNRAENDGDHASKEDASSIEWDDSKFLELAALVNYLIQNHVQVHLYTHPVSYLDDTNYPLADRLEFIKRVDSVIKTEVVHYAGVSQYTFSSGVWYDHSHYNAQTALEIIEGVLIKKGSYKESTAASF